MKCIFCSLQHNNTSIKYEDSVFYVIDSIAPEMKTHLLFIPKTHVTSLVDADINDLAHIFSHLKKIDVPFKVVVNVLPPYQEIQHLHIHVISEFDIKIN